MTGLRLFSPLLLILAFTTPAWGQGNCVAETAQLSGSFSTFINQCRDWLNDAKGEVKDKIRALSLARLSVTKIDTSSSDANADYGNPIRVAAKIHNTSDMSIKISSRNSCLYLPEKLVINPSESMKKCIISDNSDSYITLQPNSEYVFVWEAESAKYIAANIFSVLYSGLKFKPDTYVFTLNIDIEPNDGKSNTPVTLAREIKVHAELPRYAIWAYSIFGVLLMSIGWCGYQWVTFAAKFGFKIFEGIPERNHIISTFFGNLIYGIPISSAIVLLTVASNRAGKVISINILDFYGAVIAGVLVQLMVITRRHEKYLGQ
jgi:hypothetical protein